ncbi:hypothetical protein KJ708_00120, partial [bacterium]|nr:hypothetical protein [bacterium]
MDAVSIVKEFVVRIPNQVGALNKVLAPIAEEKINLNGVNVYAFANEGVVRLYSTEPEAMKNLLNQQRYTWWENEVVAYEISNVPGQVAEVTATLSQNNVNVHSLFATTGTGGNTTVYLWT